MIDQTTSTLMALLKNISEECGDLSPGNTLDIVSGNRSPQPSPNMSMLSRQLHDLISTNGLNVKSLTPQPSPHSHRPTSVNFKLDSKFNSKCSSPVPEVKSPPTPHPTSFKNESSIKKSIEPRKSLSKSPTPPEVAVSPPPIESKSPPPIGPKSPPPIGPKSPPPIIQITRTESQLVKKEENLIDIDSPPVVTEVTKSEGNA